MAATYDLRICIRKAEFKENGLITILYGSSSDVLIEEIFHGTLNEAIARRQVLSDSLSEPHAGFIGMQYRSDKKARGLSKVLPLYVSEPVAVVA